MADTTPVEDKVYSCRREDYQDIEQIGKGVSATVWRANCIPFNEEVAIKKINLEEVDSKIDEFRKEIQVMCLSKHPNVVSYHCSFVVGEQLYLVMNLLSAGSCLDILRNYRPNGFDDEVLIASILIQALRAVAYFHENGQIHRDIKAGNILMDQQGNVQMADFGVTRTLYSKEKAKTFVGTPCWMAPEVLEQSEGYGFKADIWSIGITAMELAHGNPPYHKYMPMKIMLMILQNPPPTLADMEADKNTTGPRRKFSKPFSQMVASCLQKDPQMRPTAAKLLEHKFFKSAKKPDYIAKSLLATLPPETLAQRHQHIAQQQQNEANKQQQSTIEWDFSDTPAAPAAARRSANDDGEASTDSESPAGEDDMSSSKSASDRE